MQSAKEIAASAKAGMEKTKATLQEKAEKMTARDPVQKEMAKEKKEAKIHEAERRKHEERLHSTAKAHGGHTTGGGVFGGHEHTAGAGLGHPTGADYAEEGTGTGAGHHATHTGAGARTGYGTGGSY